MRILFVATSNSIHTVRWISQLKDQGWDIYLFPTFDNSVVHRQMGADVRLCIPAGGMYNWMKRLGLGRYFKFIYRNIMLFRIKRQPMYYAKRLAKYIRTIQPDIIHSLATQGSGYLVADTRRHYFSENNFPVWWHSLWGSDIYLFSRLSEHKEKTATVLALCDFYSADCKRDQLLLNEYPEAGKLLLLDHATSGFDLSLTDRLFNSSPGKTSSRKFIMLKGYQGWSGRALVAIRALTRAKEIVKGYTVIVYSHADQEDVRIALELFTSDTGVGVIHVPDNTPHTDLLEYHSKARISIGVGISDGTPNALLEAMVMGSFPIQSYTSAANEWVTDGVTGLLVAPEDPELIELAIRKALSDDMLVDNAAAINRETIRTRADFNMLKERAVHTYNKIYADTLAQPKRINE